MLSNNPQLVTRDFPLYTRCLKRNYPKITICVLISFVTNCSASSSVNVLESTDEVSGLRAVGPHAVQQVKWTQLQAGRDLSKPDMSVNWVEFSELARHLVKPVLPRRLILARSASCPAVLSAPCLGAQLPNASWAPVSHIGSKTLAAGTMQSCCRGRGGVH